MSGTARDILYCIKQVTDQLLSRLFETVRDKRPLLWDKLITRAIPH